MLRVHECSIFHATTPLLQGISFEVAPGEIIALSGPSGAGKSTFLSWMIGALPAPFHASGSLTLNERQLDSLPTEQRRIGILFQDALLFPHLSVGQNLMMALPVAEKGLAHRRQLVEEALNHAGLPRFSGRDPATLSGGERARVSVLRALLARPQALLLDEPFSRLDQRLRVRFRELVREMAQRQALPVVLVTHDPQDIPPNSKIIQL